MDDVVVVGVAAYAAAAMPSAIDTAERLDQIAKATLEVARKDGTAAVTIRSVSAHMGGSTTLITKFIPSRGELLRNAARYVRRDWDSDLDALLGDREGIDRLRVFAAWMCTTTKYDDVIRRQWVEVIATEDPRSPSIRDVRTEAHGELAMLEEVLEGAGLHERAWLADLLYLAFRGYYVSTVEDPSKWPAKRARKAVDGLLDDLAAPPSAKPPAAAAGARRLR
jgi:AcrR family transcriptional regulator